jgi:hypothetical protein
VTTTVVQTETVLNASTYSTPHIDGPAGPLTATACISEELYVHDDQGTRIVDSAPAGTGDVIGDLQLSGDSLTLTWTHADQPQSLDLH